jgi:hypothetical protein
VRNQVSHPYKTGRMLNISGSKWRK